MAMGLFDFLHALFCYLITQVILWFFVNHKCFKVTTEAEVYLLQPDLKSDMKCGQDMVKD